MSKEVLLLVILMWKCFILYLENLPYESQKIPGNWAIAKYFTLPSNMTLQHRNQSQSIGGIKTEHMQQQYLIFVPFSSISKCAITKR